MIVLVNRDRHDHDLGHFRNTVPRGLSATAPHATVRSVSFPSIDEPFLNRMRAARTNHRARRTKPLAFIKKP